MTLMEKIVDNSKIPDTIDSSNQVGETIVKTIEKIDVKYSSKYGSGKVKFNTLKFSDGSIRVDIDEDKSLEHATKVSISAYLTSLDDVMIVAQIKEILERTARGLCEFTLRILSPMYTRYDRVMFDNRMDSFGAKVYANFIGVIGFDNVEVVDCHSSTLTSLLSKFTTAEDVPQRDCYHSTIYGKITAIDKLVHIVPDKGAISKAIYYSNKIQYDKVRDPETGVIKSIEPVSGESLFTQSKEFIVVDDLCEGGGTFMGIAQNARTLMEEGSELYLYVTHGLFTNNAIEKLLTVYDKIYAYQMNKTQYEQLTDAQRSCIIIHTLINY